MKTSKRCCWKCLLCVAALLHVVGGCNRVSNVNGEQVFEYELYAPLSVLLSGLAAMPAGWALRRGAPRLGWSMVIIGPIAAGMIAPSMFRERVVVGSDGFQVRSGVFWASDVRSFKFAQIEAIQPTREITLGRRGSRRTNYYLYCFDKSGRSSKVSVNNPVTKAASEAILRQALSHGVRIGRHTGGPDW